MDSAYERTAPRGGGGMPDAGTWRRGVRAHDEARVRRVDARDALEVLRRRRPLPARAGSVAPTGIGLCCRGRAVVDHTPGVIEPLGEEVMLEGRASSSRVSSLVTDWTFSRTCSLSCCAWSLALSISASREAPIT